MQNNESTRKPLSPHSFILHRRPKMEAFFVLVSQWGAVLKRASNSSYNPTHTTQPNDTNGYY